MCSSDLVFTGCEDICWELGGNDEINNKCSQMFSDKQSCNAMRYFCEWDDDNDVCGAVNMDLSPRDNYINTIGSIPPKNPVVLSVKDTCFGDERDPDCVQIPEGIPEGEDWKLKCSQSSWSSTVRTSYAKNAYTCCLEKCNTETGECSKDCLTTVSEVKNL